MPLVKKDVLFIFYGEGGHEAEMRSLLSHCYMITNNINYVGLYEGKNNIANIKAYKLIPMRNKYHKYSALFLIPSALIYNTIKVLFLLVKYRPKGIISTGPGSVIFPAILCKICHKKIIYIETCAMINSKTTTGKIMYFIADRFYVQNKALLHLYPNSIYAGLLL